MKRSWPLVVAQLTVVAAAVGQAPVPQQTRASRTRTRATARAHSHFNVQFMCRYTLPKAPIVGGYV